MPQARTYALARTGTTTQLVMVEATITEGMPETVFTGLPRDTLREARDRIRAAVINSGEHWPQAKIAIGLVPPRPGQHSSSLDLAIAIAIAILAAAESLPDDILANTIFVAELGLDGRLRAVPGLAELVATVIGAELPPTADDGRRTMVVPLQDIGVATEATKLIPAANLQPLGADSLANVAFWLRKNPYIDSGKMKLPE
jgi:magnesium chelatase family protein